MVEHCGECGGELAWTAHTTTVGGALAPGWRHLKGAYHRPVLGTPAAPRPLRPAQVEEAVKVIDHAPPQVRARQPEPGDPVPASARRVEKLAYENSWLPLMTYARGTPLDSQGRPMVRVERVPLTDPDTGQPKLTPTGKQAFAERRTDELVVVDSLMLRLTRRDVRLVAVWEDGKLLYSYRLSPLERVTFDKLKKMLKEAP